MISFSGVIYNLDMYANCCPLVNSDLCNSDKQIYNANSCFAYQFLKNKLKRWTISFLSPYPCKIYFTKWKGKKRDNEKREKASGFSTFNSDFSCLLNNDPLFLFCAEPFKEWTGLPTYQVASVSIMIQANDT